MYSDRMPGRFAGRGSGEGWRRKVSFSVVLFCFLFSGHFSSLSILENSVVSVQIVPAGDATGQFRQNLTSMEQLRVGSRAGWAYPSNEEYVEQSSIYCSLFWRCKVASNSSTCAALPG
jgi:hypothetical protein